MSDGVTISVNEQELQAAMAQWLKTLAPEAAEKATRKIALDVVSETMQGITRGPPRRVDTGRLRAGWRFAAKSARLPLAGLRGSVTGAASAAGSSPDDGRGEVTTKGVDSTATLVNAVEYATHVEFGTEHMVPGLHLTRALAVVRRAIPAEKGRGSVWEVITSAWEK